ncbi:MULTISPECIES: helix-turn-helix transcriptional regulator [Pseudomonas]|uniref:Transcriptional regulator, AraC family n=5 Tax=Pseudomonas syringae group TaxID=136849 RepID=A0AB37ZV52_PSESX|nr:MULTISPECIES: AraC family transcriptional regulator [Pseudomonas]AZG85684.1 AraC family transcriptional regulator [Pseudomonas syringae pv. pisi str. PP1]MBI6669837.1 helix-turn-helix transcriptional regulator [Pseudomonas syringae]MBI6673722.1 helix-turn-helix transcriptional regulator [Pseudomonas syringae]MBI6679840.1 helix-turn-helix transcriptional regulator [Pseudomonas syringae]MBI6779565.1 helix-turn-helix transcriptional regulator [Pseudomonas syringae]
MDRRNPYLDTHFCFDHPEALDQAGVFDASARQVMGSAIGHYRAHTVRSHLQYFDCDLQFPEPLRIHKVLPDSVCIVHVLGGQWEHRIDSRLNKYTPGAPQVLGLSESMEAMDQMPAGGRARMAGLRIGGDYLRELAEEDPALQSLARLLDDGMHFSKLHGCRVVGSLFERLYHSPYQGALERLNQESLSVAVLVELATHLAPQSVKPVAALRSHSDLAHEARFKLDANLIAPPSTLALARELGVGETTLRRAFNQVYGQSMLDYVRQHRLELARNLLRQRKWHVAQIAHHLGYANPANFNHAYKAYFGHPPGAES